jgi:carboxyl-terminal processing protease
MTMIRTHASNANEAQDQATRSFHFAPVQRAGWTAWLCAGLISAALAGAALAAETTDGGAMATTADQPLDPGVAQASFDQVWTQVREQYYDYARLEPVWNAARDELRPQVDDATSLSALRTQLTDLLSRIGDSHFGIVPREWMQRIEALDDTGGALSGPSATGLHLRLIDAAILATRVASDSRAWHAGIRPGWTLVEIDGEPVAELLAPWTDAVAAGSVDEARRARLMIEFALRSSLTYPDAATILQLVWQDATGASKRLALAGDTEGVERVQMANLPPMVFDWSIARIGDGERCVTHLGFSSWVPEMNHALQQHRDRLLQCPGLVIDLRGNPGGVLATMVTLAADLFDAPVTLGRLLRDDGTLNFRVLPRRVAMDGTRLTPFAGPIAILVDPLSASTSEMFAGGMQALGRARLFGETTAGMALPAQMLELASGDFLMYAFADYQDHSGRRIEGRGVEPEVALPLTRDHLRAPMAPSLTAALEWIDGELAAAAPDA